MMHPAPPAPCDGPLLLVADDLSLYHSQEKPGDGAEHSHGDIQIAVPLSGAIHAAWQTDTGAEKRQCGLPGSLLILSAGQPHAIELRETTELATLWLASGRLARAAEELAVAGHVEITNRGWLQDPLLQNLCASLLAEAALGQNASRFYVDMATSLLAAHLVRRHATLMASPKPLPVGGLSPRTLRRVLDFIHDNLAGDLSLSDIAACAFLSPDHFGRLFRQAMGQSPHRYIIAQQVERGKDLLAQRPDLSIGEVAVLAGFYDQSHFTRHFKKAAGVSPDRYRRRRT